MKICFNEATTLKNSTLEKDLLLCEKYGYDLIEIRVDKLDEYLQSHRLDELVEFFKHSRLQPYAFNALEFITFRSGKDYLGIKELLIHLAEVGSRINCKKIVVVPTFDVGDYSRSEIREVTCRVLNELAVIAEPYQMELAFEFVGYPNCSVNNLKDAAEIVERVGRKNVGIVIDCFHTYAMNSDIRDLYQIRPDSISILHMDDSEDLPYGALRDNNRLMPGKGVIPLKSMLKALKDIGYDRMASVELFRPEYWEWDAERTIREARLCTVEVLNDAGFIK